MRTAILLLHLSASMAGYWEAFTFIKIRRQRIYSSSANN